MVIKMFISGISASKEVKKHQLRAKFLLESYKINYETVDITDPSTESQKEKMFAEAKRRVETSPPLPPQFFNEDRYCGDFEDLENANDNDELFTFLGLEEDIAIENGFGKGDDEEYDFSDLLKKTKDDQKDEKEEEKKEDEDDADVEEEVVEQVTINGVAYIIPPDRKINVGGRVIDVDELLAAQGEEVDLDEVDENLKAKLDDKEDKEDNEEKADKEEAGESEETTDKEKEDSAEEKMETDEKKESEEEDEEDEDEEEE